jgi:hypothetical protein
MLDSLERSNINHRTTHTYTPDTKLSPRGIKGKYGILHMESDPASETF